MTGQYRPLDSSFIRVIKKSPILFAAMMHPYVKLHIMQLQRKPIDQSARGKIFVRNLFNVALSNKCFAATAFLCDSGKSPQTCAAPASSGGGVASDCDRPCAAVAFCPHSPLRLIRARGDPMPRDKSFARHYALRAVLKVADPWAAKYVEPASAEMWTPRSTSHRHSATQGYPVQPFVSTCLARHFWGFQSVSRGPAIAGHSATLHAGLR